jgi:uncharacterized OsmC-like protein
VDGPSSGSKLKEVPMVEYRVNARRIDAHGSVASCKDATVSLDTDVNGQQDAFNPAELFLAAIAACMIKGIERVTPMLKFDIRGVEVHLRGVRQDSPPKMTSIDYELIVDTDEDDHRLDLLHQNVRKYGTISNTVATARLQGAIRRKI